MKTTMTFNLPEEKSELLLAQRGGDFYSALWEIDQHLQGLIKHGYELSAETKEKLQEVRNMIPYSLFDDIA